MIFIILKILRWFIENWSCISWIRFICKSLLNETHSWLSLYKISFWIQQFFSLMSSYCVSSLAIASRSSIQFSSISLVSRICLQIDSLMFFFRSAIFIQFEVRIVIHWWQTRSSSELLETESTWRVNASTLMFCLSERYMILKLKSTSFCTQRIWCLLSSLSFINNIKAWWSINIFMNSSVNFSSDHQCLKTWMIASSFLS